MLAYENWKGRVRIWTRIGPSDFFLKKYPIFTCGMMFLGGKNNFVLNQVLLSTLWACAWSLFQSHILTNRPTVYRAKIRWTRIVRHYSSNIIEKLLKNATKPGQLQGSWTWATRDILSSFLNSDVFFPFSHDFAIISFRWMTVSIDLNADSESAQKTASNSVLSRASRELLFLVKKCRWFLPRLQPESQINGNINFLNKFYSNSCPEHNLTLLKPFRIGFVFFRVILLLGCTLRGTSGIFWRKIKVPD